MKIQEITIESPESQNPTVEITISNERDLDKAANYLVARLKIHRKGSSVDNIQLDALDRLREIVDEAASEVERRLREQQ